MTPARLAQFRQEALDRQETVAAGVRLPTGDSMLVPAGDVLELIALCDAAEPPNDPSAADA